MNSSETWIRDVIHEERPALSPAVVDGFARVLWQVATDLGDTAEDCVQWLRTDEARAIRDVNAALSAFLQRKRPARQPNS